MNLRAILFACLVGTPVLAQPLPPSAPFDVLHYALSLNIPMIREDLAGQMTITLVPLRTLPGITLNEASLTIDSVSVNGVPASFSVDSLNEQFTVARSAAPGETLHVAIGYRRLPGVRRPSDRRGWYWYVDSLVGLPANLGYTMSEPSDARFWMPCNDQPWDKATMDLGVLVPDKYVVASNGRLVSVVPLATPNRVWTWQEHHPIATYLMAVTVSEWKIPTLLLPRGTAEPLPLQYYVWASDSAGAANYLPTVGEMIVALEERFGPYPFDKYGMAGVVPFSYGGMEHQTITTMHRSYLTQENVVVHELAHQWWGDNVTCGTWADIWLNESFATYAEAIWAEHRGGRAGLVSYLHSSLEHFQNTSWNGAPYDPLGQGFDLFWDVVYSKGGWILHTLRGVLGDTTFFDALRAWRGRYQGQSATTADFRSVVDSVAGRSLEWFFNQWVYGRGYPKYTVSWSYAGGAVTGTIRQTQDSTWPTYTMPLDIRLYSGPSSTTVTVHDTMRVQQFQIAAASRPDSIALDPDSKLLKRVTMTPTAVPEAAEPSAFRLEQSYPNPFNGSAVIRYHLPRSSHVSLVVYDVLGREVARLVEGVMPAGDQTATFEATGLASGMYVYRLSAGTFTAARSLMLVR